MYVVDSFCSERARIEEVSTPFLAMMTTRKHPLVEHSSFNMCWNSGLQTWVCGITSRSIWLVPSEYALRVRVQVCYIQCVVACMPAICNHMYVCDDHIHVQWCIHVGGWLHMVAFWATEVYLLMKGQGNSCLESLVAALIYVACTYFVWFADAPLLSLSGHSMLLKKLDNSQKCNLTPVFFPSFQARSVRLW